MASHKHLALLALWFFALISGKARAQPDNLSSDIQEALEGASVPAIKGHGAVAVALGIDSEGTVTVWGQGECLRGVAGRPVPPEQQSSRQEPDEPLERMEA